MAYKAGTLAKTALADPGGAILSKVTGKDWITDPGASALYKLTGRREIVDPLGTLKDEFLPHVDDSTLKAYAQSVAAATPVEAGYVDPATTAAAGGSLLQSYQDAINGRVPSVAMNALRQATAQNQANVLGTAGLNTSGGNSLLALRQAIDTQGRAGQKAAGDASMLRAKEIADAQAGESAFLNANMQAQNLGKQIALQALQAPLDIEAKNEAAKSQFYGGLFNGGMSALGQIFGGKGSSLLGMG